MRSTSRPQPLTVASTETVTLNVHDLGGTGAPLLLAHATGFHGLIWEPFFSHLSGFHGWAPDFRAHGDSPLPPSTSLEWTGFAEDVLAVVDAISPDGPLVGVGHSMGGASLLLAEAMRPGTFASIYAFEPVVFPPSILDGMPEGAATADNPLSAGARRRRSQFPSRDAAYENYAAKPPLSALSTDSLRVYVEHGFADTVTPDGESAVELKCRPELEAQVYQLGSQHDTFSRLGAVRCPVVLARGALEAFGPSIFIEPISEALPDCQVEVFDHLGHFGPIEDPALVAASVQRAFTPDSA